MLEFRISSNYRIYFFLYKFLSQTNSKYSILGPSSTPHSSLNKVLSVTYAFILTYLGKLEGRYHSITTDLTYIRQNNLLTGNTQYFEEIDACF